MARLSLTSSVVLSPTLTSSQEVLNQNLSCTSISAMGCWPASLSAVPVSQIRCCILSSNLDTTSWEHLLWLRPRMTKQLLAQFLISSSCQQRNSDLAILRCSSVLVFLVLWKKLVKRRLDLFCLGFRLELEEKLQECNLRNCRIRSYFTAKTWLWMQIWLAIKPNLKCTQFGKFKKE